MTGALPGAVKRFVAGEDGRTLVEEHAARAPGPAEVVIEVAGSALGSRPGNEIAGRVVAAGEAAAHWLGRSVVVPRVLPCGECDQCRRARAAACRSAAPREDAIATHETLPARYLLAIEPPLVPEGVPLWALAALADAAALPYAAIVRAQVAPGDLCTIIGGGPRGLFATQIARAKGAHAVVVDADPKRREAALAAGARAFLDGGALDATGVHAALEAEAQALGITLVEPRFVETTRTAAGRLRAAQLAAITGGTAVLLGDGAGERDREAPLELLSNTEGTILGASACHPDLYPELLALCVRGDLRLDHAVHPLPFSALGAALSDLRAGRATTLAILVPDAAAIAPFAAPANH